MGKDTPEQARLRAAVALMRSKVNMHSGPYEARELIHAAEAMLPKREALADYSACAITVDTDKQTPMVTLTYDGYIQALVSLGDDYLTDRAQAIRAACLLKHSKRLMGYCENNQMCLARDVYKEINVEAERLIREAGV